jgi:hypothetical protein
MRITMDTVMGTSRTDSSPGIKVFICGEDGAD